MSGGLLSIIKWGKYGRNVPNIIKKLDDGTTVYDVQVLGLRKGEHVCEDTGMPRQNTAMNTKQHRICYNHYVPVLVPQLFMF